MCTRQYENTSNTYYGGHCLNGTISNSEYLFNHKSSSVCVRLEQAYSSIYNVANMNI